MTATLAQVAAQVLCAQVDLDLFFPHKGSAAREARAVCALCPVQTACLEVACALGVEGIWGGTTVKQRVASGGRRPQNVTNEQAGRTSCGTEAGAARHYRRGEPACDLCRDGVNAASRRRRGRAA